MTGMADGSNRNDFAIAFIPSFRVLERSFFTMADKNKAPA
jgi:hypothetical protein